MPWDTEPGKEPPPPPPTLLECAENLCEAVGMHLFALTDQDAYHQGHARELVEIWEKKTREAIHREKNKS